MGYGVPLDPLAALASIGQGGPGADKGPSGPPAPPGPGWGPSQDAAPTHGQGPGSPLAPPLPPAGSTELMDYFIKQGISPAAAAQLAQRISKTAEPPPPISNGIKMHPQDGAMNLLVNKYGLRPEDAQTFLSGMYNSRSKNYTPTDAPPETALQRAGDRVYYERTTGHMHGTKESDELTALAKQETQRLASMAEYARNEKPSYAFATGSDPNADSGGE